MMVTSHLSRLQDVMKKVGFDAVLVTSELNQRYLSGFNYTDGYVLVLQNKAYLITDFRYIEAANAKVNKEEFEILMPEGSMTECLAELLAPLGKAVVAIEEEELSVAGLDAFREAFGKLPVTLVPGASREIVSLRMRKDEGEIEIMKRAQAITDAAFTHILGYINPDRTELDVALELEFFMRSMGSEGTAFETIAVSGTASSMPHGVPRPVKLEKGFLTMDFGARVDGYCSDMTRTVVIGKADAEMKRLYETVKRAQLSAIEAAHAGVGCRYLDSVARNIIDGAGYAGTFGHSLGHGVGMFIHESPRLSARADEESVLEPGHVVTFEPGIYLSGKYGCRIEDMATVLPDGSLYDFTHSPKELIELC